MLAVIHEASAPPIIARRPNRAKSVRRLGAMPVKPPICMAIDGKFANPHNAYAAICIELADITALHSGAAIMSLNDW